MLFCPECESPILSRYISSEYNNSSAEWSHTYLCEKCGYRVKTIEHYENENDFHKVFDLD